jgi:GNAT superfamily N-acetyltransferase
MEIRIATTDDEIRSAHGVVRQLRPHHDDPERLVEQVRLQEAEGYRLALLVDEGGVAAVAGYRLGNNLAWGRYLYVDDLVTDADRRSRGYGEKLMDWLQQTARDAGCDELHLDSGVRRYAAHRFYLRYRMDITSHHFAIKLR